MILVHKTISGAGHALLRARFHVSDVDAASTQRVDAERQAAAADMTVLERSPTQADIARINARYAYVHTQAAVAVQAEPTAVAPGTHGAKAVLLDWAGTVAHLESAEEWLDGALAEAGITVPIQERRAWIRRAQAADLPAGRRPADLSPRSLAAWWRRDLDPKAHQDVYNRLLD